MSQSIHSTYHCHSRFDDGHGELEEYVQAAIKKKLRTLGFAGHAPVPFACDWTIPTPLLPEYLQTARRLQQDYSRQLEILVGLEVDYIPEIISPGAAQIAALKLDFTVGSVHFVGRMADGELWTVDGSAEELERGVEETFAGDVRGMVEEYYRRMSAMVANAPPEIIGHFDLVKKNNRDGRYFSEDASWYRDAVISALEAVAASPCILEVNTGGVVRGTSGALYPSEWILKEGRRREIPVMINSDAHRPEQLDGHYAEASALLRDLGFSTLTQIGRQGRRRVAL